MGAHTSSTAKNTMLIGVLDVVNLYVHESTFLSKIGFWCYWNIGKLRHYVLLANLVSTLYYCKILFTVRTPCRLYFQ